MRALIARLKSRASDDRGAVAVMFGILVVPVLIGSAAIAVDVSNWYANAQKIQRATDASSLAGVVYLPSDSTKAKDVAKAIAAANGFCDAVNPVATASQECKTAGAASNTTITPVVGNMPTQLKVTISQSKTTLFGWALQKFSQGLVRSSTADYSPPISMGSPCHFYGNQPAGGNTNPGNDATPTSSACSDTTPEFWANVAGPGSAKGKGDQYNTRVCDTGTPTTSKCTSTTNDEYKPIGQFYRVSVKPSMSGSLILQAFDPAMVHVGDRCDTNLPATYPTDKPNPFETIAGDALQRYKSGVSQYCTGDMEFTAGDATNAVTTFAVRKPSITGRPEDGELVPGCVKQFKGLGGTIDFTKVLREKIPDPKDAKKQIANPAYNAEIAEQFRQWSTLCTIVNPEVGQDYYIQVRTNLPLGATSASQLASTSPEAYPSFTWNGHNRFALRAYGSVGDKVAIAGYGRMTIYANADNASSDFYLARLDSSVAGKTVRINLFDMGDAAAGANGTLKILPPTDGKAGSTALSLASLCSASGDVTNIHFDTPTCQLKDVSAAGISGSGGYDRKLVTVLVKVPANYTCNDSAASGCWFRINASFSGGTVTDTTSWSVDVLGQPVRIIT